MLRNYQAGAISMSGVSTASLTTAGSALIITAATYSNASYHIHYRINTSSACTLATSQGHVAMSSALVQTVIPLIPGKTCTVQFLLTDSSGAAQNGSTNDYIQWESLM